MFSFQRNFLLAIIPVFLCSSIQADDPLPSWNETSPKQRLIQYVKDSTTEGESFIPIEERIAVFDNDGTLWPENPLPFQLIFAIDEIRRLAPSHPEWKEDKLVQADLKGDVKTLKESGRAGLSKLLAMTHTGITTDEFETRVRNWLKTAKHPRFDRPYNELGYQPMLELLAYLRANGFQTWIVSGGGVDFMRVWTEEAYGIPRNQIVGSVGKTHFEMRDGSPVLIKDPEIDFVDDKSGKPVAIHRHIGRRPRGAFGNSDGDYEMLEWTTIGHVPSIGLIVHHTDADREYAYDKDPKSSGKLIKGLEDASKRNWIVVDMKKDWKRVFSAE